MEQVHARTVVLRKHPRLPKDTKIEWPYNQQVRYVSTRKKRRKKATEASVENIEVEGAEEFDQFEAAYSRFNLEHFAGEKGTCTGEGSTSSAGSVDQWQPPPQQPEDVRDRLVVAAARKAHTAWDKARREFEGVISHSRENANTKGCKFEKDLGSLIAEGNITDATIVAVEQKHVCGQQLTAAEVQSVATCGKDLKDTMKAGGKLSNAMKQWFKL